MKLNDRASSAFSYQGYESKPSIHGVEVVELRRFNDDGGNMTELGRLADGTHAQLPGFVVKQINYSEMDPGAIKAFHLHHRQTDVWYGLQYPALTLPVHPRAPSRCPAAGCR